MVIPREWGVMLAAVGPTDDAKVQTLADAGWIFDMKWDGVRALLVKSGTDIAMMTRNGIDIAYRYPEIVSAVLAHFGNTDVVLDGEVVIFDAATMKPSFTLTGQRALGESRTAEIKRLSEALPACYIAFDCLSHGGADLRPVGQTGRLAVLESLVPFGGDVLTRSFSGNEGVQMLNNVKSLGLEGLVAKDPHQPYRAGRSGHWLKIKPMKSCTALTTGWEPGKNARADTFGALNLAVLDPQGDLVNIGKVGGGFTQADLTLMDPFVKQGVELVVEVQYLGRQPGTGVLRHPSFLGVRFDLDRTAASMTQFDPALV